MKNKLLIFGVVLAIILGGLGLAKNSTSTVVERTIDNTPLGALTGPDISSTYLAVNKLKEVYIQKALGTATTTPCSIAMPTATSTLAYVFLNITNGTSTATTWVVATSTSPYSTTTPLNQFSLASSQQGTMSHQATSTSLVDGKNVMGGGQYLNWGVQGSVMSDTTKLTGSCGAKFIITVN